MRRSSSVPLARLAHCLWTRHANITFAEKTLASELSHFHTNPHFAERLSGRLRAEVLARLFGNNHPQRVASNSYLDGCLTDVLTIREDLCRRLRLNAHARSSEILHLLHSDVPAAIDHAKQAQQPQLA